MSGCEPMISVPAPMLQTTDQKGTVELPIYPVLHCQLTEGQVGVRLCDLVPQRIAARRSAWRH